MANFTLFSLMTAVINLSLFSLFWRVMKMLSWIFTFDIGANGNSKNHIGVSHVFEGPPGTVLVPFQKTTQQFFMYMQDVIVQSVLFSMKGGSNPNHASTPCFFCCVEKATLTFCSMGKKQILEQLDVGWIMTKFQFTANDLRNV